MRCVLSTVIEDELQGVVQDEADVLMGVERSVRQTLVQHNG